MPGSPIFLTDSERNINFPSSSSFSGFVTVVTHKGSKQRRGKGLEVRGVARRGREHEGVTCTVTFECNSVLCRLLTADKNKQPELNCELIRTAERNRPAYAKILTQMPQ